MVTVLFDIAVHWKCARGWTCGPWASIVSCKLDMW